MSEAKWTKGPWLVEGLTVYALCDSLDVWDGFGNRMQVNRFSCLLQPDNLMASRQELEANAHLISAAPSLFEALEEALDLIDREHGSLYSDAQRKGRAALAKACGEVA